MRGPMHFQRDCIVQGTHVTNTDMTGILVTWAEGLNEREASCCPLSSDLVGEPPLTVVVPKLDYLNSPVTGGRTPQIVGITTALPVQQAPVTDRNSGCEAVIRDNSGRELELSLHRSLEEFQLFTLFSCDTDQEGIKTVLQRTLCY